MKSSSTTAAGLCAMLICSGTLSDAISAPRHARQTEEERQAEIDLLKELDNPFSKIVRLNLRNDWDFGIGEAKAMRYTATLNPVIPVSLNERWSLIMRMQVPAIYAEATRPGLQSKAGLGDITQTFYFSPNKTTARWIWGVGPSFRFPSATERGLGGEKWAAGPALAVLQQRDGWTYGVLVNHLWSFAGTDRIADVNVTSIAPFVSRITRRTTSFQVSAGSLYDWRLRQHTLPVEISTTQVMKFGKQDVSFSLGGRYYIEKAVGGPDWGMDFTISLLFPR